MTSLDTQFNALVTAVKAEVGSQVVVVMRAFLEAEGVEWTAEMMGRLEAEVGKIVVCPKKGASGDGKGKGKGKGKGTKTADMSVRCQGCDWKGGKIQNAWCKKDHEHTFKVGGETVKCCGKHFGEWEKTSDDPLKDGRVGFALVKSHNKRTSTRFMGFFGVSATNPARRPPIFPGEHYATITGTHDEDSFTNKSGDNAMDAASQDPDGKNGRKEGVYMPIGGWEGAAESVKLDNEVYKLSTESEDTLVKDLTEDTEQVDETSAPEAEAEAEPEAEPERKEERKAVDYRGKDIHLERNKSGEVYVSEEIVKWVKEDEQVNNPEYEGLLAMVSESWGKYTGPGRIEWVGQMQEDAFDTYMDDGPGDGGSDDETEPAWD